MKEVGFTSHGRSEGESVAKRNRFCRFSETSPHFSKNRQICLGLLLRALKSLLEKREVNARIAVRFLFSEKFILRRNVSPPFVLEFSCAYIVRVKRRIRTRS